MIASSNKFDDFDEFPFLVILADLSQERWAHSLDWNKNLCSHFDGYSMTNFESCLYNSILPVESRLHCNKIWQFACHKRPCDTRTAKYTNDTRDWYACTRVNCNDSRDLIKKWPSVIVEISSFLSGLTLNTMYPWQFIPSMAACSSSDF